MCVAIYKPSGIAAPSIETLKSCWDANPDGAGLAWRTPDDKHPLHIEKGFMSWKEFESYWKSAGIDKYDGDLFIHFRITTHGGTTDGNTHPFPISNNDNVLKSLSLSCNHVIMHNGVLPITPDNESISDTMMLSKLIARGGFEKNTPQLMDLLEELIGTNKIAMMTSDDVYLIGDWKMVDGVYYSNTHHQYKATIATQWDYWGYGYGEYNKPSDKRVSDCVAASDGEDYCTFIPTQQEVKDLNNGICPWCEQSKSIDEYEDCWICYDCGVSFIKDKDKENK
jgi:predicted glutamine amidotransferase